MIFDLTIKIDEKEMEKWLETQENKHIAMGHIGTHLDTYNKTKIPLNYIRSKGIIIDVTNVAEKREIIMEDITDIKITQESFVIFYTGRSEKEKYGSKGYFYNHPQISKEVILYLLKKKIRFIGIDCAGVRRRKEHEEIDRLCEENGVYIIENLFNLNQINKYNDINIYTLWFDDKFATGLRCRVFAEID